LGEAAQGEHPLDPLFFGVFFFNLISGYRNRGCPSGGGGNTVCWSPQERLIVFMRVSIKPFITERILIVIRYGKI
jgi:hypothetical protein